MVVLTGASSKPIALVKRLGRRLPGLLAGEEPPRLGAVRQQRQPQRRLTPEQVQMLVREYEAGDDMKVLATRWGLHRLTVAAHLRRAGVELRRQGLSDEQLGEAARLYGEGWSLQRLAERYQCDDETVRKYLKRAGVRMRRPWGRS
jgi:DNA-directed RNA polymerase specialized sigma24 family protein